MIEIHVTPARVEKVVFVSGNEVEEDFDFAAWQAIRPLVEQIDQRLSHIIDQLSRQRGLGNVAPA